MDGLSWMKQKRFGIVNNINLLMKGNGWTRKKLEKRIARNCVKWRERKNGWQWLEVALQW